VNIYIKIILYIVIYSYIYIAVFADNLPSLEKMVSQYVLLKKEIAQEKLRWNEDKKILFMQRDFLKREKQYFETSIKNIRKQNHCVVEKIDKLKREKKEYKQTFKKSEAYLTKMQKEIFKFITPLPESLVSTITSLLERLDIEKNLDLIERFKLILICLLEIEGLENSIILKKEILTVKDCRELEFSVLYIGLTQAFCLSKDFKIAGYGIFKEDGIEWRWDSSMALKIKKAINIYSQKEVAQLIDLPVVINLGENK